MISLKIAGFYTMRVFKADSKILLKEYNFPNIIVNTGLNGLLTHSPPMNAISPFFVGCQIGTGTTTPSATDTSLSSFSASTGTLQSASNFVNITTLPYYADFNMTFRFNAGALNGNYSEIGISGSNGLFSRALIKDQSGNPTTITILSDEFLDVTFTVRQYIPTNDISSSVTIQGVGTDIPMTIRPALVRSNTEYGRYIPGVGVTQTLNNSVPYNPWIFGHAGAFIGTNLSLGVDSMYYRPFATAQNGSALALTTRTTLAAITDTYSSFVNSGFTASLSSYVTDSFSRTVNGTLALGNANTTWQHMIVISNGPGGAWQILLDTPITKNNTQTLQLSFSYGIGRYTP